MFQFFFLVVLRDDFRTDPSDSVGLAGEPVVLECQPPRGYPEPVVSWSKDGQDVNTDGDRVKVLQDGNLMISQVQIITKSNLLYSNKLSAC